MEKRETTVLHDVQITNKREKMSKKDKPYWVFDTSAGGIMCFQPRACQGLTPTPNTLFELEVEPPGEGFNTYTLQRVLGSRPATPGAAPAAVPAPQAQAPKPAAPAPAPAAPRAYTPSAMGKDPSTDVRISKLSVFGTIGHILAEKVKVDPAYGQQPLTTLCAEAIAATEFVLSKLVYPAAEATPAPAPVPAPAPAPVTTTYSQPQFTPPTSTAFPPATPRPEAPAPTGAPNAQQLFGVGAADAEMAARVAKLLGTNK